MGTPSFLNIFCNIKYPKINPNANNNPYHLTEKPPINGKSSGSMNISGRIFQIILTNSIDLILRKNKEMSQALNRIITKVIDDLSQSFLIVLS